MAVDLPRRPYGEGLEPEVKKINNCCVMSTLEMLREGLEEEYKVVMEDPLFSHIMAIEKNGLKFSARVVQSFLCKELITSKKHEKWFVFARRSMRFSLLEFHAITDLKVKQENKCGVVRWKYDKGFWSVLLRKGEKINLKMVKERYMEECSSWTRFNRIRLIYLCVIMGVVLGKDQKVNFPHLYIKLAMDLEKLRNYPWGVAAFDCLVDFIDKTRHTLEQKEGYMMAGFLFAFQIWIMEAIPAIGEICGKKVSENYTGPSCGNWTGCAKCSYGDIIEVESLLREKGTSQSVISHFNTDGEFILPAEFVRKNEKKDERVDRIVEMLISEHDWRAHQWGVIDAPVTEIEEADEEENEAGCNESGDTETCSDGSGDGSGNGSGIAEEVAATKKRKIVDSGADTRKKKVLCHLAASTSTKAVSLDSEMKTFIEGLLTASFTTFAEKVSADFAGRMEKLETNVSERLGKMESEVTQLKTALTLHDQARKSTDDTERLGKMETEITQLKTALMVKDLGGKATQESGPSKSKSVTTASKKKVGRKKDLKADDLFVELQQVNLTQSSVNDLQFLTYDYLESCLKDLSQDTFVKGFDPSQVKAEDPSEVFASGKSLKIETPRLTDKNMEANLAAAPDACLVHVSSVDFEKLQVWQTSKTEIRIGPSMLDIELSGRLMSTWKWLKNYEIDALMFVFRERTTLRRWKPDRVGFMTCVFSDLIRSEYINFLKGKKKYKMDFLLLEYGKGELPAHGRTRKVWNVDVDRIYVPIWVNQDHWIALCICFVTQHIEVFDCGGRKRIKEVEAFAHMIPRVVKAVQSLTIQKHLSIVPYSVSYFPMGSINRKQCHCGAYTLKHIECHALGLDLSMVDDDNIGGARMKIL